MNLISTIAVGTGLLAATGLSAQEISTEVAERISPQESAVAPERPMLVLNVPVSLQKISAEVNRALVYCEIRWRSSNTKTIRMKELPLSDGAYTGVVTLNVTDQMNDELLPENLLDYACDLVLCAPDVYINANNYQIKASEYCERPRSPDENGGPNRSRVIRPDVREAFSSQVSGSLQE